MSWVYSVWVSSIVRSSARKVAFLGQGSRAVRADGGGWPVRELGRRDGQTGSAKQKVQTQRGKGQLTGDGRRCDRSSAKPGAGQGRAGQGRAEQRSCRTRQGPARGRHKGKGETKEKHGASNCSDGENTGCNAGR